MRKCKKCGIEKPLSEFDKRKDTVKPAWRWQCKECRRKYLVKYGYYEKHPERCRKSTFEWAKRNPDKVEASNRKPRPRTDARREIQRVMTARYRSRKRLLPSTLTRAEWNTILERQDYKCARCGQEKKLEQDHIIPASKGGGYVFENIQGLCRSCNASKGATL